MQNFVNWVGGFLTVVGFLSDNYQVLGFGLLLLGGWYGFKLFLGGSKMAVNAASNAVSTHFSNAKEEKKWRIELQRKIDEERALMQVRNESTIQLIEANTRALIEQAKAGEEVRLQLLENYHKLDQLGDSSFNKLKNEIKGLKNMKDEDFTF